MIELLRNPLDRGERLERVRRYLHALGLRRCRALVFGSVARGDFVAESDTDVLVISDELPEAPKARMDILYAPRHLAPEIEPVGWRESEWRRRALEADPFVGLVEEEGIEVATNGQ